MRVAVAILFAAVASGLMLAWALPPSDFALLGWLCFVPLLVAVRKTRFLWGFLAGLGATFVCSFAIKVGAIPVSGSPHGETAWVDTGCFIFGVILALIAGLIAELDLTSSRAMLVLAALAVLLEALNLLYLPVHLALTQYQVIPIVWLSSITGIWGVSFLAWIGNLWLARLVATRHHRAVVYTLAILVPLTMVGSGKAIPNSAGTTVAAIQSEKIEWDEIAPLNLWAGSKGAELAVWQEFGGQLMAPGGETSVLQYLATLAGQPPFVTSFPDGSSPMPHNAASLFTIAGESGRYHKRKPFGAETKMHAPGRAAYAAPLTKNASVGLNICFDSCFPNVIRDTAKLPNVAVIAVPTTDPESPYHFMAAVHAAYTPFRSAESGTPIIRADSRAYSMVTDGYGRIVAMADPGETVLTGAVPLRSIGTLYKLLGDWFLAACCLLLLGSYVEYRRRPHPEPGIRLDDQGTSLDRTSPEALIS